MKHFLRLTAALLLLLLVTVFLPISSVSAGDVTVSAVADPTTLFDGDPSTIDISIYNTTGGALTLESIEIGTQMVVYPSMNIPEGETKLTFDYTADFGIFDYYEVAAEVTFSDRVAYSNLMGFTRDEWIVVESPKTTMDFSFTPGLAELTKPGKVVYTLYTKNTGNVVFEDFTVFTEPPGGGFSILLSIFNLAPGEERSELIELEFTEDAGFQVSYSFLYDYNGEKKPLEHHGIELITVDVLKAEIDVTAKASYDQVLLGGDAKITLEVNNTGEVDFSNVQIKDSSGSIIKSLGSLPLAAKKSTGYTFTPQATDTYKFTAAGTDKNGFAHNFTSNEVKVTVLPADHDDSDEPDTSSTLQTEPIRQTSQQAGQQKEPQQTESSGMSDDEIEARKTAAEREAAQDGFMIILICAAGLLLAGVVILIVYLSKSKSKSKKKGNGHEK